MPSLILFSSQREPLSHSLLSASLSSDLTPLQAQVDGVVGSFSHQATDWRFLAAMMAGGLTYRLGRVGAMAAGTGRLASVGIGLGVEVTAFEMTNRSLSSLTGENHSNPNLWRWEGQGGIRRGLLNSLVTFGTLKGAGRLAQGENVIVQHILQDTGMVLGHQVSASFGITDRPQGTLAEQFLHAEATNLQLSAGMALGYGLTGGRVHVLERGLDVSIRRREIPPTPLLQRGTGDFMGRQLAFATATGSRASAELSSQMILAMSAVKDEIEPEILQVTRPHQSGETTAVRHPAVALFLKVAEKEGKSLEDLEDTVPREELLSLARLPGSPMIPRRGDAQGSIISQAFTSEANLREKFETLKKILGDPHLLGCIFAGASANAASVVFSYMDLTSMDWPEETLERLMRPDRGVLPSDLEESRQMLLKALPILGELYRILGATESGPFLRGAFIGLNRSWGRGIRFHYRDFESKVLSGLSEDSLSRLGLESVPNYRELMLRTWKLTRKGSGS